MPSGLIYDSCLLDALRARINFEGDLFSVMLCSAEYEPNHVNHSRRSDLFGEVIGDGYKTGGHRASVAVGIAPDGAIELSLGGSRWVASSINARYAVWYHSNGGDASDDELVGCMDFGKNVISSDGTFVLAESVMRFGPSSDRG